MRTIVLSRADLVGLRGWLSAQVRIRPSCRVPIPGAGDSCEQVLRVEVEAPTSEELRCLGEVAERVPVRLFHATPTAAPPPGWLDVLAFARLRASRYAPRWRLPAEDLFQEVGLHLWRRQGLDVAVGSWEALTVRVIQCVAADMRRGQRRVVFDSTLVESMAKSDKAGETVDRDQLLAMCKTDRERDIVRSFAQGLHSIRSIALETGRAPCRIRSTLRGFARRVGKAR